MRFLLRTTTVLLISHKRQHQLRGLALHHRLSIKVARALGPAAMLRTLTLDNLLWLCRDCHRRKTRQDSRLAKFLLACSLHWFSAKSLLRRNRRWALTFMLPCSLEPAPRQPNVN